jgi:hypothetical protein
MTWHRNGAPVPVMDGMLQIAGTQYPPNWPADDLIALGLQWVDPPAPTLDDLKAAACVQVRDRRWRSHIVVRFGGVEFVSDDTAATRLTAAITARETAQALGLEAVDATAGWEAKDGTMVPMTLSDLRGLLLAGVARTQAAFDRQAQLTAEIKAAETSEALAAIDLDSGWP